MYHQIWNASEFCLDPSIFFSYFNWLPDNLLCKTVIWADDYTLNISCDKPYYLSQQVVIWSYKYEKKKKTPKAIVKCNYGSNYIFGKLLYFYKLIDIDLKPRILIASFWLTPLSNN